MQIVNASNWFCLTFGERNFYSPNNDIIELLKVNPDAKFWQTNYSAFACVIVQKDSIQAIRDHFGLEPFFYSTLNGKFIFASNIPDILKQLPYKAKINDIQILRLLLNGSRGLSEYTDETYYQNICRVEPGTILQLYNNNFMAKTHYWQLDLTKPLIQYTNDADYIEHFSELLNESVKYQLADGQKIAAEFSGGLDSSSVVTALHSLNIQPALFMHVAPENSTEIDDSIYAHEVIHSLGLNNVYSIDANDFDLVSVIQKCASYFAGTPSYLFPICANNIHQAVSKNGYDTLFSGFGGDECISGHANLRTSCAEYIKNKQYKTAWHELTAYYSVNNKVPPYKLKQFLHLLKFSQPKLFNLIEQFSSIPTMLQHYWQSIPYVPPVKLASSIREQEYDLLQGKHSCHLRLRIEDSAVLAKAMGFQYKYPLLYPKLVRFCFNLPISQKRRDGVNRLLIRKYLAKYLPKTVYEKHQKVGGIMPATMHKIKMAYQDQEYSSHFSNLPYQRQLQWIYHKYKKQNQRKFDKEILLYSLKVFLNNYK